MPVKRANKSGKIYGGEDRTPLIAPFTQLLFLPSNEMFLPIRQIIPSNRKVEDGKILDGCVIIVGGRGGGLERRISIEFSVPFPFAMESSREFSKGRRAQLDRSIMQNPIISRVENYYFIYRNLERERELLRERI